MADEPNQPLQNPLSGFEGIDEARDVQVRQMSTLEYLVEVGEELKTRLRSVIKQELTQNYECVYNMAYELLKEVCFEEEDIKRYVLTNLNFDGTPSERIILGMYTGFLLHLLTKRNYRQKKQTKLYINGNGNRFDYLFALAREVDDVIVDNFSGNFVCSYIGSCEGHANSITLLNVIGDNTASKIVTEKGQVEQVIVINNQGNHLLSCGGGFYGNIKHVVVINNIGGHQRKNPNINELNVSKTILIDYRGIPLQQTADTETEGIIKPVLPIFEDMLSLATKMKDKSEEEILRYLGALCQIIPNAPKGHYEIRYFSILKSNY